MRPALPRLPAALLPLLLLLLLAGLVPGPRALAVSVTRDPSVDTTPTNAVVRWSTDVPTGSRVRFGTAADRMDRRAEGTVDANHRVELRGLTPGTEYWYAVGTLKIPLATNRFTTPGLPPQLSDADGRPVPGAVKAPPSRTTWGNPRSLQDHFDRHGADFGARNPEDYAAKAWFFLREARGAKYRAKVDDAGGLRVYDPTTRSFGAYNRDGTAKTFFKPSRRGYFDDQPGTEATPRQLQEFPLPR